MNNFYRLAGKLIDYYRKVRFEANGNEFNVKQFCIYEGKNICSFPTYKKIANGELVNNEGFYYVLAKKLGVQFETISDADEDFLFNFALHFCDVYEKNDQSEIDYFCDYYEKFFIDQQEFLVFRELWACLCFLRKTNKPYQEDYLVALMNVVDHVKFANILQELHSNSEKN